MTLRSIQSKSLFLATQALLSDLRSKAFSSVSNTIFLNLQALSTDLPSTAFSTVSMALELCRVCFLLGVKSCYVLQRTHGHKNNLPFKYEPYHHNQDKPCIKDCLNS